jgi:Spy/CpxP family protein refolding chaperone
MMQGEAMTQRLVQRGETQAQIMALLTPEQVEKYEAMHAEKAEK